MTDVPDDMGFHELPCNHTLGCQSREPLTGKFLIYEQGFESEESERTAKSMQIYVGRVTRQVVVTTLQPGYNSNPHYTAL